MTAVSYPGRIGLTRINGGVGEAIRLGQYLNGDGFEQFEHAYMDLGDGTLIQAEPGGAQIRPLDIYQHNVVHWCDNIYREVTPEQRLHIADIAKGFVGTPYSFMDYDALIAHRLGLDTDWLRHYIESTGHMICSQLVDRAYTDGGFKIFTDGRWDGFVTPGDLYQRDVRP